MTGHQFAWAAILLIVVLSVGCVLYARGLFRRVT